MPEAARRRVGSEAGAKDEDVVVEGEPNLLVNDATYPVLREPVPEEPNVERAVDAPEDDDVEVAVLGEP